MSEAINGKATVVAVKAENSVAKSTEATQKVNVTSSMSAETVLDLDSKGAELFFSQEEKFLVLDETSVRALSQANRSRYSIARQFHSNWRGAEDADFAEAFKVDREFVGSELDKLSDITVRGGLHHRWTRPDRVAEYMKRGYKILSPDEAKTFIGAKGSRHEISNNGKTELILMGLPQQLYDKSQREKVEKNKQRANAWKTSGVQQLAESGGRGFVDESASDGGRYNEIE